MTVFVIRIISAAAILVTFVACGSTSSSEITGRTQADSRGVPYGETDPELALELTQISEIPEYGFTEENPIMVGGFDHVELPRNANQIRFLSTLTGPNGEKIYYERAGSCCYYPSENGIMGYGVLDVYEVYYDGLDEPVLLYLSLYDYDELQIPKGFSSVHLQ